MKRSQHWWGVGLVLTLFIAGCSCGGMGGGPPSCSSIACVASTQIFLERPIEEAGRYELVATLQPDGVEVRCSIELEERPYGLELVSEECDPPGQTGFLQRTEDAVVPLIVDGLWVTGGFESADISVTRDGSEIAREHTVEHSVEYPWDRACHPECVKRILRKAE